MITIKLLGGARRLFSSDVLLVERDAMTVNEMFLLLQDSVRDKNSIFESNNFLVAVNGVDSSALEGNDTNLKGGDVVSIIPVVHGGTKLSTSFEIMGQSVELVKIKHIVEDPAKFLETLRAMFPGLVIQGVNSKYIVNTEHAKKVIKISLTARKRGIMLSDRIETDVLMRFACTGQISDAICRAGLNTKSSSLLVVIGRKTVIQKMLLYLGNMVIPTIPFSNNTGFIMREFGITRKALSSVASDQPLVDLLLEKSAVLLN